MSLKGVAEEYFSNLNPIASRIYSDFKEVKSSYEDLWNTISDKEQQEILSESIIKPEVSLKYPKYKESPKTDYAVKLVFDENCSYRDEHSGPFSFKTKSQRDLTIFESDSPKTHSEKQLKHTIPMKKLAQPALICRKREEEDSKDLDEQEISGFLPKTGLDFLDNW